MAYYEQGVLFDDQGRTSITDALPERSYTVTFLQRGRGRHYPHPVWHRNSNAITQVHGEPADWEPAWARVVMNPEDNLYPHIMKMYDIEDDEP